MYWWVYVIGGIVLLLVLLILCPVGVRIRYDGDFRLYITLACFKFRIFPPKTKKIRLKYYSKKAMEKRRLKALKKQESKNPKKKKKNAAEEKLKNKDTRTDFISHLIDMTEIVFDQLGKRLKITLVRLNIIVGGEDAAAVAVNYGLICTGIQQLCAVLDGFMNFGKRNNTSVAVVPDFIKTKTKADIDIAFTIRFGQIFGFLWSIRNVIIEITELM